MLDHDMQAAIKDAHALLDRLAGFLEVAQEGEERAHGLWRKAEDECTELRERVHGLTSSSWADSVQECEAWRERAEVAEAALAKRDAAKARAFAEAYGGKVTDEEYEDAHGGAVRLDEPSFGKCKTCGGDGTFDSHGLCDACSGTGKELS